MDNLYQDCPTEISEFLQANTDLEILERIERGANGIVFFAKRIKANDHVVLKFYIGQDEFDESEESVILLKIEHPNILKVHDIRFIEPHHAFFISPKISGGDLQNLIDGEEIITSHDALRYIRGILIGLTKLHSEHELVHRDLKPGNILFDNATKTPVIADLGSVKQLKQDGKSTTTSKATRLYLPFESIVDGEYDYRSDLYQVGLILFQLLGGKFPIETPKEWLNRKELKELDRITNSIHWGIRLDEMIDEKIVKGKIADTNTLPFYLDRSFKALVNKAIQVNRNKRFQTPYEFLIDVDKVLQRHPCYSLEECLLVEHQDRKYRISNGSNGSYSLEKQLQGKQWRRVNGHDGTIEQLLDLARNKS